MSFNEFVNNRRKELNMSVDDLVRRSGLPKGTVSKITAGINTNPTLNTIEAICRSLLCSLDEAVGLTASQPPEFSNSEREHIRKYRTLDGYGRSIMDSVLEIEYDRCNSVTKLIKRPCYFVPVSAGFGNPLDNEPAEEIEISDTPKHREGDYVVRVSGDSMFPQFSDGDMVLVKEQPSIEIGEIGIFVLNGDSYIKKLGVNELISLNQKYPPKPYSSSDDIRCLGKVLCKI